METNEEVVERWQREASEAKAFIEPFEKALATALGVGWAVEAREIEGRPTVSDYRRTKLLYTPKRIERSTGIYGDCALYVGIHRSGASNYWRISGGNVWNRRNEFIGPRAAYINCSIEKTAEQVAKDINRRFLPDYMKGYDAAVEQAKVTNVYETELAAAYRELCALLDYKPHPHEEDSHTLSTFPRKGGEAYLQLRMNSSKRVHVEVDLNMEQARQVIALLKKGPEA